MTDSADSLVDVDSRRVDKARQILQTVWLILMAGGLIRRDRFCRVHVTAHVWAA